MVARLYKWFFIVLITLPLMSAGPVMHPFYVSVTEINHNASERSLEISCKVFVDDLEAILKKNYGIVVDFTKDSDKKNIDKYVSDYITKNLLLTADGKNIKMSYLGAEKDSESAWVFMEVTNLPSFKKLQFQNSILYDFNETQINIMHVTNGGKRQSAKVVFPEKAGSLNF